MRALIWLIVLLLAAAWVRAAEDARPNLVMILVDDLGYNDVGCFGSPLIKTPNIDRMAAEGIRFTSFYAQNVCGPSRAALMTGCYPIRIAEPHNTKSGHTVVHADEITVAELLKQAGYATGLIGKWHLAGEGAGKQGRGTGPFDASRMPNAQGFDYFFGTPAHNGHTREHEPATWKTEVYRNSERLETDADVNTLTKRETDEAVKFIRDHKSERFFVYLAYNMVHVALGASEDFRGKSPRGLYGDATQEIDFGVGQVLATLKELGIDDNTLVVFTSDNGPWVEASIGDYGGSAYPLRGFKMNTWEGGLRVPGVVRWPGHVPAGKVSDAIVTTLDVLPTFASLAGAKLPTDRKIDGVDMSDFWRGNTQECPRDEFFYYAYTHLEAVRDGAWKLVLPRPKSPPWTSWYGRMIDAVPAPELYNLDDDISEKHDVAAEHPDIVARLMKRIDAAREDLGDYNVIGTGARFFDPGPHRPDAAKWINLRNK
ncbi:MAG: sulfatase-like hydrolase/transferase [Planctomycetes bacterium]|nr:sulfatase-like hydrolase/transferase [Planctomycetota bacterium]